jgi:hypothetical protein
MRLLQPSRTWEYNMRSVKTGESTFVKGTYHLTLGVGQQNVLINAGNVTGALRLPKGTTGQQANPVSGDIRFNTTTGYLEYYDASNWRSITFQQNLTITKDAFTGDGSTTLFGPLSFTPASANNVLIFVQGVFQQGTTNYTMVNSSGLVSGTLNYILFGSAPPLSQSIVVLHGFDKT